MQTANDTKSSFAILKKAPKGLSGAVFWLTVWFCLLFLLRMLPGTAGLFFTVIQVLVGIALASTAIPLFVRTVRRRMLWSLRNKLVVTYLLIGLAPLVLFVILVSISGYVAAGQFAIHLTDSRLQEQVAQMSSDNGHRIELVSHLVQGDQMPLAFDRSDLSGGGVTGARPTLESSVYINGAPAMQEAHHGKTPLGLPPWAAEVKGGQFSGLVLDGNDFYLTALNQRKLR